MNTKIFLSFLLLLSFLAISAQEASHYKGSHSLSSAKVAIVSGTTYENYMQTNFPANKLLLVDNFTDAIALIESNRAMYTLADITIAEEITVNNKKMHIVDSMLYESKIAAAFRKEETLLHQKFNSFLESYLESEEYKQMALRYYQKEQITLPTINHTQGKPFITVGLNSECYPFTFIQEGAIVGIEVEIAIAFAQYADYGIKFENISFGGLIAALSSGRIDMVTSGLCITNERAAQVNFSTPYASTAIAVIEKDPHYKTPSTHSFTAKVKDSFYNNIIKENRYLMLLDGLKETLIVSLLSILFGTLLGAAVCFLRMSKYCYVSKATELYIHLIRGIPVVVLLMINYYILFAQTTFSASTVAIISFALNFSAYTSEMFRSSIRSIDKGQREAGIAMGFTEIETFLLIILPQCIKQVAPIFKGEAISLIKMTSVVGYITVQDLTKVSDIIRGRTFDAFFPLITISIIYFALAMLFSKLLDLMISRFVPSKD